MATPLEVLVSRIREDRLVRKKRPAPRTKPVEKTPDALVLCTIEVHCEKCGAVHSHPSHHMLLRFGACYTQTGRELMFFRSIPREHITKKDTAPACENCFGIPRGKHFD